ncbi:hypothetical protein ALQ85_100900 [Pseudomonas syringae]|uniref:Uncharacterized protein n=1 Tax=Pseudomonas syringae pv. maculicola TaxID=59511 RepID=A0A0N8RXP5_PSEYM|nr:hypothetical protein ALO84_100776 [Pseudomonas syringae pv. maculicola]RMM07901.1 hypothetical protein ALQ85_100900 [Pseudomonas syringae]RMO85209.1 hypothetical protein ALQ34_101366 [Pseudomonas syringae pv. maculicola]RMV32242.1 hypothetical protein ALP13_101341 [Pseudomonas syringae pv. maculicola]
MYTICFAGCNPELFFIEGQHWQDMKQETCLTGQLKPKNLIFFLGFTEIDQFWWFEQENELKTPFYCVQLFSKLS